MAISDNTKKVIDYLKSIGDQDVTADDVAAAVGSTAKSVNAAFTAALQNKGYGVRVPCEVELPDGTHKPAKLLKLTPAGMAYDYNTVEA